MHDQMAHTHKPLNVLYFTFMNKMKKLRLNPEQRDRLDNAAAMFVRALKDPVLAATHCALWWQENYWNDLFGISKVAKSLNFNRMILKMAQDTKNDSEISKEDWLDLKAFHQELLVEIREQKIQMKNIQRSHAGNRPVSAHDREALKRQYEKHVADRLQEEPSPRDIQRREAYMKKDTKTKMVFIPFHGKGGGQVQWTEVPK